MAERRDTWCYVVKKHGRIVYVESRRTLPAARQSTSGPSEQESAWRSSAQVRIRTP